MRYRGTLILLAVLAALGAYVLLVERGAPAEGAAEATPVATAQPALFAFSSVDARAVRLERPSDGARTELAYRDNGLWHITVPLEAEANQSEVVRLVEELASVRPQRALTEATALPADFGLDPAALRVSVELADGARHTLLLGARNVGGTAQYALVEGADTVYLVPLAVGSDAERFLEAPPVAPTATPEAAPPAAPSTTPAE